MLRKHSDCNTFGRCSDGIDVYNYFETSSKWTGISQIMKKDFGFRSSGRSCFSATKENKSVHYAVCFTTCNLTGMEGKVSGPRRVSIHFEENFGILGHS